LKIQRELRGIATSLHLFWEIVQKASNTIFYDVLLVIVLVFNYNGIVKTQGMVLTPCNRTRKECESFRKNKMRLHSS